ncbi:hypothetical protein ACLB2K_072224 [Fragaria x ananassa]
MYCLEMAGRSGVEVEVPLASILRGPRVSACCSPFRHRGKCAVEEWRGVPLRRVGLMAWGEAGGAKVYREHVMWRVTITRALEAWCRVPQSPREGRKVTGVAVLARLSLCGESVRAWLETVAIERCGRCVVSQSALGWGDSLLSVAGRCPGDESVRAWLARLSLCGESVRAWLATVAIERCGRCVASQSALGWGDSLLSVAGRCPGESVRAWLARLSLCGESVRAWLATVAIERCGRCVASQSAFGWGDSLLSVAGHCPGKSVRAWLGTVAMWRANVYV